MYVYAQKGSKSPVYAVYRVIVALFLLAFCAGVVYHDFYLSRPGLPRRTMIVHYGYWAFLFLTIDFSLQVALFIRA